MKSSSCSLVFPRRVIVNDPGLTRVFREGSRVSAAVVTMYTSGNELSCARAGKQRRVRVAQIRQLRKSSDVADDVSRRILSPRQVADGKSALVCLGLRVRGLTSAGRWSRLLCERPASQREESVFILADKFV